MKKIIEAKYIKHETSGHGKIAVLTEPYLLHPEDYIEAAAIDFDIVLSNHKRFVERNENWFYCPHGGTFLSPEDWTIHSKSRKVSMFISNKNTMPGHKLRHEVLRKIKDIDYFGKAVSNYVYSKLEGLTFYSFSIVIESCQERGYFTEKIIDCFLTGTVPVYWGDPDIGDYFNVEGIWKWDGDIDKLEEMLQRINLYTKYLYDTSGRYIEENFELAKKYTDTKEIIKNTSEMLV